MDNNLNNNRITSLDGLKAIMLFVIFFWHIQAKPRETLILNHFIDFGARTCEILFIISGFLVGYKYYKNTMPATLKQSLNYVSKKISLVWPLHFICFVMLFIHYMNNDPNFINSSSIYQAIVNVFLLQTWIGYAFSYNGATWFISALLFCYFLTPFMLPILHKSRKIIITTLVSCIIIRIGLELSSLSGLNFLNFNFHTSPIIRCLEFFIGMLMVPAYYNLISRLNLSTTTMSILEILITASYMFIAFKMEGKWIRGYFVLAACILVFIYTFNKGMLSKLLSMKIFRLFSKIQMEFYILHQVVIKLLTFHISTIFDSIIVQSILLFCITAVLSILYNHFLKQKLAVYVDNIFQSITNILHF